jgi:hypothetical protein
MAMNSLNLNLEMMADYDMPITQITNQMYSLEKNAWFLMQLLQKSNESLRNLKSLSTLIIKLGKMIQNGQPQIKLADKN